MTEEKSFEPITTQDEFDERIKARLAREREKWEKESGVAELQQEIDDLKREHYREATERAIRAELASRGVTDKGRIERILKLVDLDAVEAGEDGQPDRAHILSQLDGLARDLPELVRPRGAGSRGSSTPVIQQEKQITRDELEGMSEQEINSRWDQVKAFLAGERT
jgi:ribosomal protein L29